MSTKDNKIMAAITRLEKAHYKLEGQPEPVNAANQIMNAKYRLEEALEE